MERCLEEISSTVLDAGEPLSYRTLGIRSRMPSTVSIDALAQFSSENDAVQALHVLVKRSVADDTNKSDTAAAKRDPRARVLSLTVENQEQTDDLLCQQIYALYGTSNASAKPKDQAAAMATACWAQERQARNDALDGVDKHAPLTAAAKALYASGIKCAEASARQDFGEEQGEETISAFDAINASAKKKPAAASSSFFKSSGKSAGFSKSSGSNRNGGSKTTTSKPVEAKKLDMSNVLTVDSDDEEDDDTDAPVFVKKTTSSKRVISDDDDEEDEAPTPKATSTPAPKSRNVKRKLNASPAATKKAKQTEEVEENVESEEEADDEELVIATKRRVLVSKTRINEQGYMVTEKTYEEVKLTPEEVEKEQKAAKKKLEDKKKKAAAEKAAKAKKETKKHSGPPKQRDLRSFFSVK
ncbi:hypothetical protein PR001_g239 [Phytophthora rubi]|uniref:DNA polymerase delta subunit 3 n=1 Tax=Phytophthora rubi TaxID=129364 RepID=A0A6A3P3X8_9STRA|nr:hypothetical protein PR002_g470 [Phytophthora rubi]KAE9052761.1 hypothetical protein PR001_g239 [Phytophthora rubi]